MLVKHSDRLKRIAPIRFRLEGCTETFFDSASANCRPPSCPESSGTGRRCATAHPSTGGGHYMRPHDMDLPVLLGSRNSFRPSAGVARSRCDPSGAGRSTTEWHAGLLRLLNVERAVWNP